MHTHGCVLARGIITTQGAKAVVVALDKPNDCTRIVKSLRRDYPNLPIFVRATRATRKSLLDLGAQSVVTGEQESALLIGAAVLKCTGKNDQEVISLIEEERSKLYAQVRHAAVALALSPSRTPRPLSATLYCAHARAIIRSHATAAARCTRPRPWQRGRYDAIDAAHGCSSPAPGTLRDVSSLALHALSFSSILLLALCRACTQAISDALAGVQVYGAKEKETKKEEAIVDVTPTAPPDGGAEAVAPSAA
jgi:hypothetical protein